MADGTGKKGQLLVASGPAGSGKGTAVEALCRLYPGKFALSVSCTTRAPRGAEVDGVHYFFLSKEEFERRIEAHQFLEYAVYCNGNSYGTPKDYVLEQLSKGFHVILEIDVQGGLQVKENYPDTVLFMLTPPNYAELERRLRGRHTDREEDILRRLAESRRELERMHLYDYVIVSETGKTEDAARQIYNVLQAEQLRTGKHPDFIKEFYGN